MSSGMYDLGKCVLLKEHIFHRCLCECARAVLPVYLIVKAIYALLNLFIVHILH